MTVPMLSESNRRGLLARGLRALLPALVAAGPLAGANAGTDERPQAARRILEAYRADDAQPTTKKLHLICWRTREREFPANYRARLRGIMEHIRDFYAAEMERNGLGRLSFPLDYDTAGALVIHEAVGSGTYDDYTKQDGGTPIRKDCWRVLRAAGLDPERETVVIFTNLGKWDPEARTFSHHSPYMGSGTSRSGIAWQLDHPGLDVKNLTLKEPLLQDGEYGRISLGKHNSIFIGGIAHELGHALGLPHCRETAAEARTLGKSLMGAGNRTYASHLRGEGPGSFLALASALQLASHPLFSGSAKGLNLPASAKFSGLAVTTKPGEFVVSGSVAAAVPVHAVVAYLDPQDPPSDYDARTVVTVPKADGTFTLRCNELTPGKSAALRLRACLANGATHQFHAEYRVARDGTPDVAALDVTFALENFLAALETNVQHAATLRETLPADSRARRIASAILAGRTGQTPKLPPAAVPADVKSVPLSHVAPAQARVGWLKPTYDNLPRPDALLISGAELFDTGIFAHAPATYRYDLTAGGWTRLIGKCGLPQQQPFAEGSVVFVIRADGKEVLRTKTVKASHAAPFDIPLAGVRELELITEDAGDGNACDWGLWLGVELTR